ncbi:MFS transporter [Conexivisphaera calida]|nr:MFS transporter [Conexivisphaera calida]
MRRPLMVLAGMRVTRSLAAGVIYIIYPYIALKDLGLPAKELGIIYAAAALATALLSILVGYAADLMGRRASLYMASSLMVVSSLLLLLRIDIYTAVAAAILGGISATGTMGAGGVGGAVAPVQTAILADLTSREERTRYITWLNFGSTLASTAGLFVGGIMDYEAGLATATVLGLAALLSVALLDTPEVRARTARMGREGSRVAAKFSATGILNGLSSGLVSPFLVPIFILLYDIPRSTMGIYSSLSSIIAVFVMLSAPAMERKLGFVRSIAITRGATVVLLALFPFIRILYVSLAIYLAYPALRVAALPVQTSGMVSMVPPEERGRTTGFNQGFRLAFASVGTLVASPFIDPGLLWVPFIAYSAIMSANVALYRRFFGDWDDR